MQKVHIHLAHRPYISFVIYYPTYQCYTRKKTFTRGIMKKLKLLTQYIILSIVSFLSVFPLYYAFCNASGGNTSISKGLILPGTQLWDNVSYLLFHTDFLYSFSYTLYYSTLQTVLTLIICSLAGYGFEVYQDKKKDFFFKIVLFSFFLPFTPTIVPLFMNFSELKLINTTFAMITPFLASPLIIMLFRQQSRNFPFELVEAARLDGLREPFIFLKIYLPIMKPTFVCGIVISFLQSWNSYQWPRIIMIHEEKIPMVVYLTLMQNGDRMTQILLSMLPTLLVFFLLQKYFVKGMQGAVK